MMTPNPTNPPPPKKKIPDTPDSLVSKDPPPSPTLETLWILVQKPQSPHKPQLCFTVIVPIMIKCSGYVMLCLSVFRIRIESTLRKTHPTPPYTISSVYIDKLQKKR